MRQPRWVTLLAWLVFALAVLLPLIQLGKEALWFQGQLDLSPLRELLLTQSQWALLTNSLLLAAGASSVALILGLPFALLCQKTDLRGRTFFGLAYLVPLLIPPYMQAIVWSHLLAKNGSLNALLMAALGLSEAPLNAHSLPGAIFVLGLAYFPFVTLLTVSGLKSTDSRYEEAALLQQGTWRTLTRITLPLILPHIIAGTLFVFIFSIIDFGVPDILRVKVYPIEIFIQFSALYNERAAVVLGLPLLLITTVLIVLQVWTMRGRSYVSFADGLKGIHRYSLGWIHGPALAFCLAVVGLAVLVPVGVLLKVSGSLASYQKILNSSLGQIGFSFLMAAAGATAMTVLAFLVAHTMIRSSGKLRIVLEYLTQLPFAIPPILLGLGLIKVWNRPITDWLYGSYLIIIVGYLAHFIPFTIRAIYASLQQLNPRLEEMGCLSSAGRFRVTGGITLPLIRNGLMTGFFISFILALGELGVTLLVIPPGMATIPIKIYNFMHYGAEAMVAALCLILLAPATAVFPGLAGPLQVAEGWRLNDPHRKPVEALRSHPGSMRPEHDAGAGYHPSGIGSFGLRQDQSAAADRRIRAARHRPSRDQCAGCQLSAADSGTESTASLDDLSGSGPVATHDGIQQHSLRTARERDKPANDRRKSR